MTLSLRMRCLMVLKVIFILGVLLLFLESAGAATARKWGKKQSKKNTRDTAHRERKETAQLIFDSTIFSDIFTGNSHLANNSLSPWVNINTPSEDYYPPIISQAKCLKVGCLDSKGQEDMELESRPIRQHILLLKRVEDRKQSKLVFRVETKVITVGCTCIRPTVVYQN